MGDPEAVVHWNADPLGTEVSSAKAAGTSLIHVNPKPTPEGFNRFTVPGSDAGSSNAGGKINPEYIVGSTDTSQVSVPGSDGKGMIVTPDRSVVRFPPCSTIELARRFEIDAINPHKTATILPFIRPPLSAAAGALPWLLEAQHADFTTPAGVHPQSGKP
jgi:hypothetical protein